MGRKKGYKHTEKWKKEMRKIAKEKGFGKWMKEKTGKLNPLFGNHKSKSHKKNLSKALSGSNHPNYGKHRSVETKRKIGKANAIALKGNRLSDKTKIKISKKERGKNHWNWKGGITALFRTIRHSLEYQTWIKKVFKRDNYTCQKTKIKGGKLEVHHIKSFAKILKENNIKTIKQAFLCHKLWDIDNGITLSEKAHKDFHIFYGNKDNTKEQLDEFLKYK